jgi:hypothetical protein
MILKLTRKDYPTLFETLRENIIEESYSEHRRGSNFFTKSIIEIIEDDVEFHPEIDLKPLFGFWETNVYISDTEYGTDWRDVTELTRVEKKQVVVTTTEWAEVK